VKSTVIALGFVPFALAFAACGDDDLAEESHHHHVAGDFDAGGDSGKEYTVDSGTLFGDGGACHIVEGTPDIGSDFTHVAAGTVVTYSSNPPAGGPHYPVWAAYREFDHPLDRRNYVHDEEHGGVVFLYNCPQGCPEVLDGLRQVIASLPDDPLCTAEKSGVRVRAVLTPDPLLDVPVAAAAWGHTYKAECFDSSSLRAFALANYGHGREALCAQGADL
jgi:hypothetical protein